MPTINRLRWLTTFNPDIWQASGSQLAASWKQHKPPGQLLLYAAGMPHGFTKLAENLHPQTDPTLEYWYRSWIERNADVIPESLGGKWKGPCSCGTTDPHSTQHKLPCPDYWFCKHAARWLLKIVCLMRALPSDDDIVIWLDADTEFTARPTEEDVLGWFGDASVFYLKGPKREAWETGVIGFRGREGREAIRATWKRYSTNVFRQDPRWCDPYQIRKAVEGSRIAAIDLATDASGHSDVVPHSPLAPFLTHKKGLHGRVLGLFT